jgi:hypothetical protein
MKQERHGGLRGWMTESSCRRRRRRRPVLLFPIITLMVGDVTLAPPGRAVAVYVRPLAQRSIEFIVACLRPLPSTIACPHASAQVRTNPEHVPSALCYIRRLHFPFCSFPMHSAC